MARKKGEISQSGVKQKIIIYILENNGPLEESKIREKLNKKKMKKQIRETLIDTYTS